MCLFINHVLGGLFINHDLSFLLFIKMSRQNWHGHGEYAKWNMNSRRLNMHMDNDMEYGTNPVPDEGMNAMMICIWKMMTE